MHKVTSQLSSRGACHCGLVGISVALVFLAIAAQAAEKPPDNSADINAIRANIDSYVAAYNRGDAKAVAAHWSDSGEWISPSGERFQGKQAIEKELQTSVRREQGRAHRSIAPVHSPCVARCCHRRRHGSRPSPGEPPSDSTYLAVNVKKDGQWKLDTVRETEVPEAAPRLRPFRIWHGWRANGPTPVPKQPARPT